MAKDNDSNEVEIDLDKYMALIEKLDEQEDQIKEMKEDAIAARNQLEPKKRKFGDLFLDDNDVNEKSIIGFMSFAVMTITSIVDMVTGAFGNELVIQEFIYNSFVVITLGCFGIAGAEKIMGKK